MVRNIRKSFVKSAACFAVLCALGTGVGVGNLMAHNGADISQTMAESVNPDSATIFVNQGRTGQNFTENVTLSTIDEKVVENEKILSFAVDIGSDCTVVSKSNASVSSDIIAKKTRTNTNCSETSFDNVAVAAILDGAFLDISCDDAIRALCNNKPKYEFYKDDLHSDMLKIKGKANYALMPLAIMDHVEIISESDEEYAKYVYENGECQILSFEQYQELDKHCQFSDLMRAARIIKLMNLDETTSNRENVQITLTYGDQLSGKEIIRLKKALIKLLNTASVSSDTTVNPASVSSDTTVNPASVSSDTTVNRTVLDDIRDYGVTLKLMPQSLAVQTEYFWANHDNVSENEKKKVVIVNYGYGGLSICGSEYTKNDMTVYPDQYFTDCAGRAIDKAIMADFKDKIKGAIKEANIAINIDKLKDNKISNILKELISTKEKLSASGADEIAVNLELDPDEDDISFTYSVDKLNECLTKAGIVDYFDAAVRRYISDHKAELGEEFDIVIMGGSLRIPLFQKRLTEILKEYNINRDMIRTLNMDESAASGASLIRVNSSYKPVTQDANQPLDFDAGALYRFNVLTEGGKINKKLQEHRNELEAKLYKIGHAVDNLERCRVALDDAKVILTSFQNDREVFKDGEAKEEKKLDLEKAVEKQENNLEEQKKLLDSELVSLGNYIDETCPVEVNVVKKLSNYGYDMLKSHLKILNTVFDDKSISEIQNKNIEKVLKTNVIQKIKQIRDKANKILDVQLSENSGSTKYRDDARIEQSDRIEFTNKMNALDDELNNNSQRVTEISSVPAMEVHVPSRGVVEKVIVDYGLKFALDRHVSYLGEEAQQVEDERREEIDDINGQLETFKQKIDELSIDKEQIINKVNELAELSGIKGDKLSSTSDSKTIVDRILQLQTSETSYKHALMRYTDTAGDDVNHSKEHFKALVRGLDQKYDAIKKVANDLLGIIESSPEGQKLVNALRHVFKKNAKLDWINVLQDDMNGLLKTAEPQQPVVPQDTGTDQPTMFDTEGTEGSNNGTDTGADQSTMFDTEGTEGSNNGTDTGTDQSTVFNNAGTLGGFSSTVWSYVKPVLSAPLRVFNWVRSWF